MGLPAARVGDAHADPPHGPGVIVPACEPTVLIGGRPAARIGDSINCGASIIQGSSTVLIGNRPAARLSDGTSHSGAIILGFLSVLIGSWSVAGTDLLLSLGYDEEYIQRQAGGLNEIETRDWYAEKVKEINVNMIASEENAKSCVKQRNLLKQSARRMMADQNAAGMLNIVHPIRGYDYYYDKYSSEGYSGKRLFKRIIEGSISSNKDVNKKYLG